MSKFGFKFGSMNIERVCGDFDGPHVVKVKTPKSEFSIRATKTGRVRFFDDGGNECELVSKDYVLELEAMANIYRNDQK